MSGAILLLPHMPSWDVQGQLVHEKTREVQLKFLKCIVGSAAVINTARTLRKFADIREKLKINNITDRISDYRGKELDRDESWECSTRKRNIVQLIKELIQQAVCCNVRSR
jgi:hypothetical protein